MQKSKSKKRVNKTMSVREGYQEDSLKPVKDMFKQIQQLKVQLATIKSKKNLNIFPKQQMQMEDIGKKQKYVDMEATERLKLEKSEEKQNKYAINKCKCHMLKIKSKQHIRIDLFSIDALKSRQNKLKYRIQLNKLKSTLERLYNQSQHAQAIKLLILQLNAIFTFTNSIVKQYQYELQSKNASNEQMKVQLAQTTNKVIKLAEKHSNQKSVSSYQIQQINELKRHLSYYMQLVQESKQQISKCKQENDSLQKYANQLQYSSDLAKKQVKLFVQQKEQLVLKNKQNEEQLYKINKQYEIIKHDLHISQIQCGKNKDKWRQSQKQFQKLSQQFKQLKQNCKHKQFSLLRRQDQLKQLRNMIQTLRNQQSSTVLQLGKRNIQIDRFQRQISLLNMQIQQKNNKITQLDNQILQYNKQIEQHKKQINKLNESLSFCQMEIQSLTQQLDKLKLANQRYKNQHFRNKALESQQFDSSMKNTNRNTSNKKQKNSQAKHNTKKYMNSESKKKQKILGEIQQLIEKHKRNTSSDQSEDN